ncbi:MAG TPA: DUF58 domain-containing protein, partial [Bacillota bacterium]
EPELRARSSLAAGWTVTAGAALILGGLLRDASLLLLGSLLLATVFCARQWVRTAARGLGVELDVDRRRLFAGDRVRLKIALAYRNPLPLGKVVTKVVFRGPVQATPGDGAGAPSPAAGGSAEPAADGSAEPAADWSAEPAALVDTWIPRPRLRLARTRTLILPRRGLIRVDRVEITALDPLGLFAARLSLGHPLRLIVYPRAAGPRRLPTSDRRPGGPRVTAGWLWPDPALYAGARPYRPGDPLRWVDWRATARRRSLQVKTFDSSRRAAVAVLVDLRTYSHPWDGVRSAEAEGVLALAAGLLLELEARGCRTLLVTNMARLLAGSALRPAGSLEQQLEELAAADPHGTAPAAAMLPLLDRPEADTVLVCSPLRDPSLAQVLHEAKRRRRSLHLFSTMPTPPPWVLEACTPDSYAWLGATAG